MSETVVYRATTKRGEECHFGEAAYARAWAGKDGTVDEVVLNGQRRELRLVEAPSPEIEVIRQQLAAAQAEARELRELLGRLFDELQAEADECAERFVCDRILLDHLPRMRSALAAPSFTNDCQFGEPAAQEG